MTDVSLIIPVHNEEKILEKSAKALSAHLSKLKRDFEIVLIENGSSDRTYEIAKKLAKKNEHVTALYVPKKGLGGALKKGILEAKGEILMWYPIDMSIGLDYMGDSLRLVKDHDIVVGSKEHKDSKIERPFRRKVMTKIYDFLVNLLFGLGVSDSQCVKTFRKEAVTDIVKKTKETGLLFEVELLYYARRQKLRIIEVPVVVKDIRKSGESKIDLRDMVKTVLGLGRLRARI